MFVEVKIYRHSESEQGPEYATKRSPLLDMQASSDALIALNLRALADQLDPPVGAPEASETTEQPAPKPERRRRRDAGVPRGSRVQVTEQVAQDAAALTHPVSPFTAGSPFIAGS